MPRRREYVRRRRIEYNGPEHKAEVPPVAEIETAHEMPVSITRNLLVPCPPICYLHTQTDMNLCLISLDAMPSPTVTVTVGKNRDEFQLQQAPLIRKSALFREAWEVRRASGEVMLMELPEVGAKHFRLYEYWLYPSPHKSSLDYTELGYNRKKIPDFASSPVSVPASKRFETRSRILADDLVHLWAIGRLLGDHELQRTVMDGLVKWYVNECIPSVVSEQTIAFIDKITDGPQSPLRQFCVRWARCRFKMQGELPQFGQAAPRWLSNALLSTQARGERHEGATKSTQRMRRFEKGMARKAMKASAAVRNVDDLRDSDPKDATGEEIEGDGTQEKNSEDSDEANRVRQQ